MHLNFSHTQMLAIWAFFSVANAQSKINDTPSIVTPSVAPGVAAPTGVVAPVSFKTVVVNNNQATTRYVTQTVTAYKTYCPDYPVTVINGNKTTTVTTQGWKTVTYCPDNGCVISNIVGKTPSVLPVVVAPSTTLAKSSTQSSTKVTPVGTGVVPAGTGVVPVKANSTVAIAPAPTPKVPQVSTYYVCPNGQCTKYTKTVYQTAPIYGNSTVAPAGMASSVKVIAGTAAPSGRVVGVSGVATPSAGIPGVPAPVLPKYSNSTGSVSGSSPTYSNSTGSVSGSSSSGSSASGSAGISNSTGSSGSSSPASSAGQAAGVAGAAGAAGVAGTSSPSDSTQSAGSNTPAGSSASAGSSTPAQGSDSSSNGSASSASAPASAPAASQSFLSAASNARVSFVSMAALAGAVACLL